MSKGITAFVVVLAPVLAISMLSGVGYYDSVGVDYADTNADADVQSAANALTSPSATDTGGTAIVEFTTGAADTLQTFWEVLANTSGVVKLLFGLPSSVANDIQTLFQIIFGITFLAFIRGVRIQ